MNSSKPSIEEVWTRLKKFEGDRFETKTGKPFTYKMSTNVFYSSRTKYSISKIDFRKALALVPFDGPGVINRTVRGPAYVWSVLHDRRIRKQDW